MCYLTFITCCIYIFIHCYSNLRKYTTSLPSIHKTSDNLHSHIHHHIHTKSLDLNIIANNKSQTLNFITISLNNNNLLLYSSGVHHIHYHELLLYLPLLIKLNIAQLPPYVNKRLLNIILCSLLLLRCYNFVALFVLFLLITAVRSGIDKIQLCILCLRMRLRPSLRHRLNNSTNLHCRSKPSGLCPPQPYLRSLPRCMTHVTSSRDHSIVYYFLHTFCYATIPDNSVTKYVRNIIILLMVLQSVLRPPNQFFYTKIKLKCPP